MGERVNRGIGEKKILRFSHSPVLPFTPDQSASSGDSPSGAGGNGSRGMAKGSSDIDV